ncbi:MAG: NAD(P)/FAD-dependent oxidoreductase [Acidobacteriota bacterium]|nr:MAG: NAD(P)/FAD-dependent oxidoreductase [Acidobacteriota bacterium]
MGDAYDVIVVGGGHNGLTAAAYLAKNGKKVLVLERRHIVGGCAVTEEVYPGFKYTVLSYVVSLLRPEVIRYLELPRHGLDVIPLVNSFLPLPDGNHLFLSGDEDENHRQVSRFSRHDADALPEFQELMEDLAWFVQPVLSMVPPDPRSYRPSELGKLFRLGKRFRELGEDSFFFTKLLSMSVLDFLDMFFESDVIKAQMCTGGIVGASLGPRSPGTATVLLHLFMGGTEETAGEWGFARGGMGAVSEAIASSARSLGVEIRTEAPVAKILVRDGTAKGVVLESGEEIRAKAVASGVDPKRTFLKLLDREEVPPEFLEKIRNFRLGGGAAKVNMALDGLPDFTALPGDGAHLRGDIMIAPSTDYLERAYDDAKYGKFSRKPFMEIVIPSLLDPTLAPPGKHVMSVEAQYTPYELKAGHWNDHREALGDTVVETLSEYAPNLKDIILHRQVVTPWDMEQEYGLTEGTVYIGELTPDQMFMLRPVPGWARYRMPVDKLYLCGGGAHPGGGVMGAPGRLAALEMLKDFGSGSL